MDDGNTFGALDGEKVRDIELAFTIVAFCLRWLRGRCHVKNDLVFTLMFSDTAENV